MTTTAPTAEAFLAQPADPEDEEALPEEWGPGLDLTGTITEDPLESIAASLRQLVVLSGGGEAVEHCEHADDLAALLRDHAELQREYDVKQQLIEDTLKTVSKSTSKLADSIRALLEAPVTVASPESIPLPAHDASVEEWRAYAAQDPLPPGTDLEQMNRSQIRSLLGVDQPVEG